MHDLAAARTATPIASRVVPDSHRPGPSRVRLVPEEIPVWALIGYARAIAEARSAEMTSDVVAEVAHDYAISPAAVRVALDWYARHPHAIDTVLADNAAALNPDTSWVDPD